MRYFLEVRYLGKNYFGWQIQPRQISIQEHLESGLSRVLSLDMKIHGSSRTDTGVHAKQQFAHFDVDELHFSLNDLKWKLNSYLPNDIAVLQIHSSKEDSHSRFDAVSRKYIYRINLQKDPFTLDNSFYFRKELNVDLMNKASTILLKNTDFECFSKVKTEVNNFKCQIEEAEWKQFGHNLEFHIKANRFLRGMVRAIVGTLLDIGQSKINVDDFQKIIDSKDRRNAGSASKANGLTLEEVNYPENYFLNEN
jgi:tRNA pseudouridine38-40 synthase